MSLTAKPATCHLRVREEGLILDALPGADPAQEGAQRFPAASALQHVRYTTLTA